MDTREETLQVLPGSIRRLSSVTRSWNGVRMDITDAWYKSGEVLHELTYEDATRLVIMIDEVGGTAEPRSRSRTPCHIEHAPYSMAYAPGGMPLWGYSRSLKYCRDATFMFDFDTLTDRLEHHISPSQFEEPRLRFADAKIWQLAKMLTDLPQDYSSYQLFGDSITAAMFALLFQNREVTVHSGNLAPWQLNRVVEYLNIRLPKQVGLQELASLVGLSQWHFSRAFKSSTGLSPYQWQLNARIEQAKTLLAATSSSVEAVADATGFGDAVHLIRIFKRKLGVTPAVWRKQFRS